jgi:VanZ family protein
MALFENATYDFIKGRWHAIAVSALIIVAGLAYGAIDEQTQKLVGRDCSLRDWIADAGGAVTAVVILLVIRGFLSRYSGRGSRIC